MFALSAVAVDKEMVGNDSDGELIGEFRNVCCCAAAAARRADVALCASPFDRGDVEKKDTILFPREETGRVVMPLFSPVAGIVVVDDELFVNGLVKSRGIVDCSFGRPKKH